MKFFWDTSAVINAAVSPNVESRLEAHADKHVARLHVFYEFFSTMTGRGVMGKDANGQPIKILFDGNDAAEWLKEFSSKVTLVEVDCEESLAALAKAQSLKVRGAHVYDYAHALAAVKAEADTVLTRNEEDFKGLTGQARIEWP